MLASQYWVEDDPPKINTLPLIELDAMPKQYSIFTLVCIRAHILESIEYVCISLKTPSYTFSLLVSS